jgi:NitT/TauT family transport system permease protein
MILNRSIKVWDTSDRLLIGRSFGPDIISSLVNRTCIGLRTGALMDTPKRLFSIEQAFKPSIGPGDAVVLAGIAGLLYLGVHLAHQTAAVIPGPVISLDPRRLPLYAGLSLGRMAVAYALSLIFSLVYGYLASSNRHAERVLMPILDVLQSVPIFSFLPVVLLSLSAVLPQKAAAELAAIILIFTSQAWNMTFAWYQSLSTIPKELKEADAIFRFNWLMRLKTLELPFGAVSLIWNSMMSWAGGWFFLMAAEIFTVGQRDFRLPGLGAYLAEAAGQGDLRAIGWGAGVLLAIIVALDQLVWRPLLTWADRFKLELVEAEEPRGSWFHDLLLNSAILDWMRAKVWRPAGEWLTMVLLRLFPVKNRSLPATQARLRSIHLLVLLCAAGPAYGAYRAAHLLAVVPASQWGAIGIGVAATFLRVATALVVAFAWTVPLGVAIGTNPRLAGILQPLVQIAASLPATAIFPVFLLFMLKMPGGLNLAAIVLMLAGTQWYLLFNVIAGAAAIPQDLKYTTIQLHMSRWQRWRNLIFPSLFPYIITGGIAASGGAWNASVVAEYTQFGGQTYHTVGIGALIARASARGDYAMLLASTLSMIIAVVAINRLAWRRLYRLAQERYRME